MQYVAVRTEYSMLLRTCIPYIADICIISQSPRMSLFLVQRTAYGTLNTHGHLESLHAFSAYTSDSSKLKACTIPAIPAR